MKNQFNYFFLSCCVFSIFFFSCSGDKTPDNPLNTLASLPASFHFGDKGIKVLTSSFNRKTGNVSLLFGNEKARQQSMDSSLHPAGAEWALVTWKAMADKHWFGADIPGELLSVETVTADSARAGRAQMKYARYAGKELAAEPAGTAQPDRIREILALRPAIMP